MAFLCLNNCTERSRDNPLDPGSKEDPKIRLSVLSYNDRVELSWNEINLVDFLGYNVYRKNHPDSSFLLIASGLYPGSKRFTDTNIQYKIKE